MECGNLVAKTQTGFAHSFAIKMEVTLIYTYLYRKRAITEKVV